MIKEYFLNYEAMSNDFTVHLGSHNQINFHSKHTEHDWKVTLADTGEEPQTGARIKKIGKYLDDDLFMVTYGDGVANLNIKELLNFHKSHNKLATVTGVHPSSRFGELVIKGKEVFDFNEKPQIKGGLVNGGFFVFNKKVLSYLKDDDDCYLEREPLERLAADKELMAYTHEGFWQSVDTYRELESLNALWKFGNPPWKIW